MDSLEVEKLCTWLCYCWKLLFESCSVIFNLFSVFVFKLLNDLLVVIDELFTSFIPGFVELGIFEKMSLLDFLPFPLLVGQEFTHHVVLHLCLQLDYPVLCHFSLFKK